ncbi:hypothetical protein V2J09_024024 [Rumex salicifolius]
MAERELFSNDNTVREVNLTFRIPYFTHWGQSLLVCGSEPLLGAWDVKKGLLLSPIHVGNELVWRGSIEVPSKFGCEYNYYVVDDSRNILRSEMGKKRKLLLSEAVQHGELVELRDLWLAGSDALPFRSAFKDVIFRDSFSLKVERPLGVLQNKLDKGEAILVNFSICCPNIEEDTQVYVIGSSLKLGQWKVQDGLKLSYAGDSTWQADCMMPKSDFPLKYPSERFCLDISIVVFLMYIISKSSKYFIILLGILFSSLTCHTYKYCKYGKSKSFSDEIGANRELSFDTLTGQPRYVFLSDGMMREMPWRGAGMAIPMFSVRSEEDLGVGEFLDLKLLVDWSVSSGFHLVQLLPINDTSVYKMWWDSYPYSSLSVFALHPLYLRVQALSKNIPKEIKEEIVKAKESLDGKAVDYDATMATKLSIAKKIFSLEKDSVLSSSTFQKFFSENEEWLRPYAAFCFLRDFFETSDHSQWGRFSQFSKEKSTLFSKLFNLQLKEASEYARQKGVILKGDLPIGVGRDSVDTWVHPNLFRMNTSTGAPPDYFDKNGQNWGFPTYNWEEMSKDNYGWWRARLTQMGKYFTAYRIDHILGFFRIWELPDHAMTGLLGKFRPSIPLSQGKKKMLVIRDLYVGASSQEELEKEGIKDLDRLSEPYIRQEFLQEKFGSSWTIIASNFLNEYKKFHYEFREDCNTEKKIASKLKDCLEKSSSLGSEDKLRRDLFDILQNIVLIRDPEDARKFYPRFNLEDTTSFKDLDDHSKNVLKRLYYDYYFHRQEKLWHDNAMKTLPVLLNSSDMLSCGEDLGLIPSCVHPCIEIMTQVMQELGLIGLRIQRMPNEPGLEFSIPSQYSYMTVCAPSCHDCSTLRAWWEEDENRRRRYFKTIVESSKVPPSKCVPAIAHFVIRKHLESPSMWAIFPLQDLLALKEDYSKRPANEETINDPTNPKHYWRYRSHVTMETLVKDQELNSAIKDLVRASGRAHPSFAEEAHTNGK